jgi:hypothetical protein
MRSLLDAILAGENWRVDLLLTISRFNPVVTTFAAAGTLIFSDNLSDRVGGLASSELVFGDSLLVNAQR